MAINIAINSYGKCEGYVTTRDIGSAKLKEAKLSFARLGLTTNRRSRSE